MLRLEKGNFGFVDMYGARLNGTQKLTCELTLRDGKVVYDLNGMTRPDWTTLPQDYRQTGDARWDAITPAPAPSRPAVRAPLTEWIRLGAGDPILSPRGDGFESAGVFNPAVVRRGSDYVMIYRAQDRAACSATRLRDEPRRPDVHASRRSGPGSRGRVRTPRRRRSASRRNRRKYWLTYTAYKTAPTRNSRWPAPPTWNTGNGTA